MSESPLSVCLVAPLPPPYGGISHWADMICRRAATRSPVRVEVVDTAPRWRAVTDLKPLTRYVGGSLQVIRDTLHFVHCLKRGAEVIHLTTSGALGVGRDLAFMACARAFGVPVVYHLRFGRVPELVNSGRAEWRLLSKVLRGAAATVVLDRATEDALRGAMPVLSISRIPNCVDASGLPPVQDPQSIVLFLSWVIPSKGIDDLMVAWTRLRPCGWRLLLAGPGEPRYLQRLFAKHAARNVEWLGELEHSRAMALLATAGVLVLPSHTEGFPNVVLEAMALGRAIVATSVGAIPEMLDDGCGIVVPPRDSTGLRDALGRVMGDAALRSEIGARAYQRARTAYSIEKVFEEYLTLWRHVAATRRGATKEA